MTNAERLRDRIDSVNKEMAKALNEVAEAQAKLQGLVRKSIILDKAYFKALDNEVK